MSTFALVAKAGGSEEGSENTCAAVRGALAVKPPAWARVAIEIDVRLTRDGALVALHDESIDRTTNGRGRVRDLTLRDLEGLTVCSSREPIPLLEEVLDVVGEHDLVVDAHDAEPRVAEALVRALRPLSERARRRVVVASEHTRVVRAVRRLDPRLRTAATPVEAWQKLLFERLLFDRWSPRGRSWFVPELHRGLRVVTPSFARSATLAGDDVWVFVVNEADDVARLLRVGATGCFTARPRALAAALAAREVCPRDAPAGVGL